MREYALILAQPTLSTALVPLALQCFKTALMRRKIRNALLRDGSLPAIGLADADLRRLLALPLSCDLAMAIERIKFLRTRDRRDSPERDAG
jgi:hypothetical protein